MIDKWLKPLLFLACLAPAGAFLYAAFSDQLSPNPVEDLTRFSGEWGLKFLLITLAMTPLRKLARVHSAVRMRRMFGLFAFAYMLVHFITYIWLDQWFDWAAIGEDIFKRPFIFAGFTAFVLLIPLAATSTNGMIRRLGGARWRTLHKLVYFAAIGGLLHYLWLVKADTLQPAVYMGVFALLMIFRLPSLHRLIPPRRPVATQASH